jgi:glycosyltransferase involved in cell wall biosynthesis
VSRLVSIITPLDPGAADFLEATYRSVIDQVLPSGWDLEWLVHADGGAAPTWLADLDDERVRVSSRPDRFGPAVSRNLLLARASGEYIKVLDGDDQLLGGALERDIRAVITHPEVTWVTSRVKDLLGDGSFAYFDNDPPPGTIEIGAVFDHWMTHDFRASVHPATLFAGFDAVAALGGWMALPGSEDTALLLSLNARHLGCFVDDFGLIHRRWDKQLTVQPNHQDAALRSLRFEAIRRRVELLLSLSSAT